MTEQEANQCVAFMGRLFPSMSRDAERLRAIRNAFTPLRAAEVRRAIEVRVGLDQFPDVPAIVAWCTPPAERRKPAAGESCRVNGLTADALRRQRERDDQVLAERAREQDVVRNLDVATAEQLRSAALLEIEESLRPMFRTRPILRCPLLVHLVAKLAETGEAIAV